jgi:hypothetical protein
MIGRPPPPAAPKSGPPCYRLCHSKVAGQDTACRVVERASSTLRRPKTQDKCQSLRTEGALGFCVAVFMVFRSVGWRLARLAGRVGVKERRRTGYLRPGDLAVLPIGHGDRADFRRRR